jgi:DinB superfamily
VEDNWIRDLWLGEPRRYPFGHSVRDASREHYPAKAALLAYFHEVRDLTKKRLQATTEADFDKRVHDAHFGPLSIRDVWGGVITSFAWHAGQIALTNRLMARGS